MVEREVELDEPTGALREDEIEHSLVLLGGERTRRVDDSPALAGDLDRTLQNPPLDASNPLDAVESPVFEHVGVLANCPLTRAGGVDECAVVQLSVERFQGVIAGVLVGDHEVRDPEPFGVRPERGDAADVGVRADQQPRVVH